MTRHMITIYFDAICAWSYIGHRSFFQAISLFQKTYPGASSDNFDISWRPYYRDRALPDIGVPLEGRLESAYGTDGTENVKNRVVRIGRVHGINFVFSSLVGSTRAFHQLNYAMRTSREPEIQRRLVEDVYFHWHEVGCDITNVDFLVERARAVGFPEVEARRVLTEGCFAKEVDNLDATARANGIACVPTFEVNGTKVEGAADTATFYQLFVDAKEKETGELSAETS